MKIIAIIMTSFVLTPLLLCAQPLIDPAAPGKSVGGSHLLRLKPVVGQVFHYRVSTKSQVSAKNSDELLNIADLKPNDKALFTAGYYVTVTVRRIREDGASDFQIRLDSTYSSLDDNGSRQSFTSSRAEDARNPVFEEKAIYTGKDLGVIVDTVGNFKEIYGFYNIVDNLVEHLPDSLQTGERIDSISDVVLANTRKILHHLFCYLPRDPVIKDASSNSTTNEQYAVWSTLEFPMQKDYKELVFGFEERNAMTYAIFNSETQMTPVERVLDEPEYHTTLPNYAFSNKDVYYVDRNTGMLAYDKWTEDQSYTLKIESKLPEKSGKNFATVQRSKVETVVELLR